MGFLGRTSECRRLDEMLAQARDGRSAVLVIRGEAGIGKTSLLRYAARQAAGLRVVDVAGVQAEMELPDSGIQRLVAPLLGALGEIPAPQRNALRVASGLAAGDAPDRFLVAVAVLTLLAVTAASRPVLCLVDDVQWLDPPSLGALGFVARRLGADAAAMIFALREPSATHVLDDLPQLPLEGLEEPDARALLARVVPGRLDDRVRDRIVGETRGNPLGLLELSRGMSRSERAGGFPPPGTGHLTGRVEARYLKRVNRLPKPTRHLVLVAAAEPLGDAALLWRAADRLSIEPGALAPATEAGLLEIDDHVRFRHPLVRSAVYGAASPAERRHVHDALAEASDPELAADSRAWHRALAAAEPAESVAADLTRCAGRARDRGGLAAAAAFLERAAALTPDPARQAGRALAAAEASFQAGEFEAMQRLLATAQSGVLDGFQQARAVLLRGHAAAVSRYGREGATLLLEAARRLEPFDLGLARRAYLTAWSAAVTAHHLGGAGVLVELSQAIRALPPLPPDPHPLDLVLDAYAVLITDGHADAMPVLRRAAEEVMHLATEDVVRWGWQVGGVRTAMWHDDAIAVYERQARLVREAGALAELPIHLQALALERAWRGDLPGAERLVAEAESISRSTGNEVPPFALLRIRALQGREAEAGPLIDTVVRDGTRQGQGIAVMTAQWAAAVLNNGLGRYAQAAAAAGEIVRHGILPWLSMWARCELVEAAAGMGDFDLARDALDGLVATTSPAGTHLALGIEARCRALLEGDDAEASYTMAIDQLAHSGNHTELARAHLLYGAWLRGRDRLPAARERLRAAEEMFAGIGMEAFAERTRAELAAAGARPRLHRAEPRAELTSQEEQIARLARDGLTNAQIGADFFLSPRTVEWHLNRVYGKLGIVSRDGLDVALLTEERKIRVRPVGDFSRGATPG
ncbi:LuxR family transcriptional regulator fused with ATPase domain [Amycolatopsis mediterranei S699]|uniref:LuxR family transcriptional regulator fused with ATPase domain n=2 Tax=Amycolatopsis mediterranei TaxID=33910 RepID=A0A0H3DCN4_AMYMU|nr:LuxR family transcriptional regulator fused with ATPase domain [Amycolatopsis mediterranei U32]AEK44240.1 LuxR family transcriptional regulator fused with ATPase domain [Amycolatopsis mediterranei S699]AGT86233.1 LuxR family transcriptional regulator fused with ATPase domain [Amycolatopsis mediterranei RB]KDO12418.1 LuxR family transcriptional regulator [Amycolatopsis mediterranei]AFO79105.1 LuxR family transcriptional regulator fused with ATPase domain [Amycolatopsis mediterranei S699]